MSEQQRRLLAWTEGALKALDLSEATPPLCPHRKWADVYDDRAYLQGIYLGLRFGSFHAASLRHMVGCVGRVIRRLVNTNEENEAERKAEQEAWEAWETARARRNAAVEHAIGRTAGAQA